MKTAQLKISQSLIKDVRGYLSKEICGNVMHSRWIARDYPDCPSKEMALGTYFEYIFTEMMLGKGKGSLPKSGNIPRADYYAASLKTVPKGKNPWDLNELGQPIIGVDGMLAPYQLAHKNAERLVGYFKAMDIVVKAAGQRRTKKNYEGTIDLECEWTITYKSKQVNEKGQHVFVTEVKEIVIDLKYSGMIFERWNHHGWVWTDEQRAYHGTQAKQYHYITDKPFYFLIVSSKNEEDVKFFHIQMDEFTIEQHLAEGKDTLEKMKLFQEIGFEPYPDVIRCAGCPLKDRCKDKVNYPEPENVDLRIKD